MQLIIRKSKLKMQICIVEMSFDDDFKTENYAMKTDLRIHTDKVPYSISY